MKSERDASFWYQKGKRDGLREAARRLEKNPFKGSGPDADAIRHLSVIICKYLRDSAKEIGGKR